MTQPELTLLPGAEPDELDVELYLAGAVVDEATERRILAAMEGPLSEVAVDLEAARADWAGRSLPVLERPQPTAANRPMWATLALAAAALLVVAGGLLFAQPEDEVRSMGMLPVDTWAVRDGQSLGPGEYAAGDYVFLRLDAPRSGFVTVALVAEDGEVTVFQQSPAAGPVEVGTRFSLDGALLLDDDQDKEWVIVALTDRWYDEETMRGEVSALLPDPERAVAERGWWAREITRER